MSLHLARAAVLVAMSVCFARLARAQQVNEMALNQLEPTPAGDPFFGVPSPFIGGHLVPRAIALVDHSAEPFVITTDAASGPVERAVVGRQTLLHLGFSLAILDRLRADVLLPLALTQSGESPMVQDVRFSSPSSAALGDLRLGVRIRVLGEEHDPIQLAGGAYLHLPTGASEAFVSDGALRDTPYISLGGRTSFLFWSASVGLLIRGSGHPATFNYGAGAALLLADGLVQVGLEAYAATPVQEGALRVGNARVLLREQVSNAEVLLGARLRLPAGLSALAGAGVGLSDAIGTPAFRAIGGLGWALPDTKAAATAPRASPSDGGGRAAAERAPISAL